MRSKHKSKARTPLPQNMLVKEDPKEILAEMRAKKMPQAVVESAQALEKEGIQVKDTSGRRDMRDTLTFTIDPDDAKDFDDAISIQKLTNGDYEIGIHIADVSYYVQENSLLDKEAKKRATSVYLVDRVVPMLPEGLSNDLCSLVEGKDRLTVSAIFDIDQEGRVKKEWFGRTVINSKKRMTYKEAEEGIKNSSAKFHEELTVLNTIAKNLTKERFKNGAVSIESDEVKFVLDKNGKPIGVTRKTRGDSNKLIEEFMLLANKRVAEFVSKAFKARGVKRDIGNFMYRIHDLPDKEKMADLTFFLKHLGYKVQTEKGIIPNKELNKILKDIEGKPGEGTVNRAVTRSMAKAIYSTKNIGHYGLAFPYYTHFTSPIRRYPDIVSHRILLEVLENKKIPQKEIKVLEQIAINSSLAEKRAVDAERASIKEKQVDYMGERIGQVFDGIVSGVSEWGLFIEEAESKSEGMVRMRDLGDDYFVLDERKKEIKGTRTKKIYAFGDKVKIKVKKVDFERKTIDYILV